MIAPTTDPRLPAPHQNANYRHLIWDVVWFGLAAQAIWRFLGVYAVRIGMTPIELGLLSSLPSVAFMVAASLSTWWRRKYRDSVHAMFWPSLLARLKFLLPAFTPFFPPEWQPFWLITTAALTSLPDGVASTIFVVLLRESVHIDRLATLVSRRNIALNIGLAISALALGFWLKEAPFPGNYQVMFAVSFVFVLLSLREVMHVRVPESVPPSAQTATTVSPWRSPFFHRVAAVAILMHLPVFFLAAIFNLRLIDEMGADEAFMSILALVELAAGALVSAFADRLIKRLGNLAVIALIMVGMSASALIVALSPSLALALVSAAIGGAAWALGGIGLFGYFTQITPAEDMTRYSTAYHQVIFLSVFVAPLLGSALVNAGMSLAGTIFVGGVLRLAGGGLVGWLGGLARRQVRGDGG